MACNSSNRLQKKENLNDSFAFLFVLQEVNLLNVQLTEIKAECEASEIKFEDTPVPAAVPIVKCEAEVSGTHELLWFFYFQFVTCVLFDTDSISHNCL